LREYEVPVAPVDLRHRQNRMVETVCPAPVMVLFQGFSLAIADEVVWSYDLMELPPGWTHEGFSFDSSGAHTYIYNWHSGSARALTYWLESDEIKVPSGWDSLVIDISQHVTIQSLGSSGFGTVEHQARVNSIWYTVWRRYHSCYTGGTLDDSTAMYKESTLTNCLPASIIVSMAGSAAGDDWSVTVVDHKCHWASLKVVSNDNPRLRIQPVDAIVLAVRFWLQFRWIQCSSRSRPTPHSCGE